MTSIYSPMNKAVPPAGLLQPGDDTKLALQGQPWTRLCSYLEQVGALTPDHGDAPAELAKALGELRSRAERFGSPRKLRELVQKNPDVLASEDAPGEGYVALVWLIQNLHVEAERLASGLATLTEGPGSRTPSDLPPMRLALLRDLAGRAAAAMHRTGPLRAAVLELKTELLQAHAALAAAVEQQAKALQDQQVDVGRRQQEVKGLKQAIAALSMFAGTKKKELHDQLEKAQASLSDQSRRADKLREWIAALEPVVENGNWLERGLDDLVDFLEAHRKAWMGVSSGLTEVAAQASSDQLLDARWTQNALGAAEAQRKWTAIDRAAKEFTANALVDW
jgi:hypothetical protein